MSFEEKVVEFSNKVYIDTFKNAKRLGITTFSKQRQEIKEAEKRIDEETEIIVKNGFRKKFVEYKGLVHLKSPVFNDIFEVAKDDYVIPIRGENEKREPFLNRAQNVFDQLEREVEIVKEAINKSEKLERFYKKKSEFKQMINEDLNGQRNQGIRTTIDEMIEYEKAKLQLPKKLLTEIVSELAQEKLNKEEYERFNDSLSPVIYYKGKRINVGRFYTSLKNLRNRGVPFHMKKEDVEASLCDDFDIFVEWLRTVEDTYKMEVQKIERSEIDKSVYGCRRDR